MESQMPSREPVVRAVFEKLGGRSTLGVDVASAADLARVVLVRIPLKALTHVMRTGSLSDAEIRHFIIPARTRRHRQQRRGPLHLKEAGRFGRVERLHAAPRAVV